ncbi:MAG: hypothetical protein NVS4B3_02250 [Gemmatimonadaceae bacterium]
MLVPSYGRLRRGNGFHIVVTPPRLVAVIIACGVLACSDQGSSDVFHRPRLKSDQQRRDSADVAERAIAALRTSGATVPLRVESVTRGTEGWLVRLLPSGAGLPTGGGTVWVGVDRSTTVIKRY